MPDVPASGGPFPRVLFITPATFNHVSGGGITFSNLFRGWPRDRIATVHNDATPVTTDICERYYRLSEREITAGPILARLRANATTGAAAAAEAARTAPSTLRRLKT